MPNLVLFELFVDLNNFVLFIFQGMTLKSLKKHTALQPLFVIMGLGMTFVVAYCIRLATRTTDVAWRKQVR
jgi:hypothetical protein